MEEKLIQGYHYVSDISNLIIHKDKTVIDALSVIDKSEIGIAIVINSEGHVLGVVVDSDIRKFMLNGGTTSGAISEVMNKNPYLLKERFSKEDFLYAIRKGMKRNIPVIDDNNMPVGCVSNVIVKSKQTYNNVVVLMLGGRGIRLMPYTNNTPKPMLEISEKPLLEIIINQLSRQGFNRFIFTINYLEEHIRNYFKDGKKYGVNIEYIIEDEYLGTSGALGLIKEKLEEPFFVMNGDLLTKVDFRNILEFHEQEKNFATIGSTDYGISVPYGVFQMNGRQITKIIEKPVYKYYVNAGIYLFNPDVLELFREKQYYDMVDLLNVILNRDFKVTPYPIIEYWLDIGRVEEYKKANIDYKEHFEEKKPSPAVMVEEYKKINIPYKEHVKSRKQDIPLME